MPIQIAIHLIHDGAKYKIYEIARNRRLLVSEFTEKLEKKEQAKLGARIERVAQQGHTWNEEIFRHEEDGIYALKCGQIRIYGFFHEGYVILLTNGVIKKKGKADPEALKKAKRLRDEFLIHGIKKEH